MDDAHRTATAHAVPRLITGHGPRRRPDGGIQLGSDPVHGLVLDGLTPEDVRVLSAIDGRSTRQDLTAHPTRAGGGSPRADQLLDLLGSAGLLADPAPTSRDRDHTVLVDGTGAVARGLAGHLADAGVGTVRGGPYAVDAADASGDRPDLVVVVAAAPVGPARAQPLRARGIRHLVVSVAEAAATVGPLVRPGQTPCLECLERHRGDRDPGWPASVDLPAVRAPEHLVCEPALVPLAAALAAAVGVAALRNQCPGGVTLDVELPWPQIVQRQWTAHPGCGCGAARVGAAARGRQWSA